ncbi:hypothetical protein [Pirellulimonas nuda]|uniref:hypothetical protein n=1 Tax=Pirellulimonas nuda TaxID=2528009 RepID=UPI0011A9E741|nr:hypothetical protein [Pirellulimonas nuda]
MPRLPFFLLLLAAALVPVRTSDAATIRDTFDGPTPSLQVVAQEPPVQVLRQSRIRLQLGDRSRTTGSGAERIDFRCDPGYAGSFSYATDPLAVLDELSLRVHLAASRPGVRVGLRIVLPRVIDPDTKAPAVTVVMAEPRLEAAGAWGWIVVDHVPQLLEAHARVLRVGRLGAAVDTRGAYATGVVLSSPGAPTGAWLLVEEINLEGAVQAATADAASATPDAAPGPSETPALASVAVRAGGEITAEGRSIYPLIWTHQGESLKRLAEVGFNVVAMEQLPEQLDLEQARELGLWIVCPPPSDLPRLNEPEFAAAHSRVLAWWIDPMPGASTRDQQIARCGELRAHDTLLRRPLITASNDPAPPPSGPELAARPAGRTAPGVAATRVALVPVTHSGLLLQQRAALATRRVLSPWKPERDVADDLWRALAGGSAGVWFQSEFELTQAPAAARAADELTLCNRRLALAAPWLVAGRPTLVGPGVLAWRRDHCSLLISQAMFGIGPPIAPLVPTSAGLDETMRFSRLDAASLQSLYARRVPGGVQIDSDRPIDALVACEDPRVLDQLAAAVRQRAGDNAQITTRLATSDLLRVEALQKELPSPTGAADVLTPIRQEIGAAKAALAVRNWPAAFTAASRARAGAAVVLGQSQGPTGLLISSPLAGSAETLADNVRLLGPLGALPRGPNLLAGGDFESLEACRASGWRHETARPDGAEAAIAAASAPQGSGYLRLSADASDGEGAAWIGSPEVHANPGETLEVLGMVRFDAEGGVLRISDSLGGDELGITVRDTIAWRPFRLLRIATAEPMVLRFELDGAGAAGIDAVMVRRVMARPVETASDDRRPDAAGQARRPAAGIYPK